MSNKKNNQREKGTVLIIAIWIVFALAGLTLILCRSVQVEAMVSANHISSTKAQAIIDGAIDYVIAKINNEALTTVEYDATAFEAMEVGDGYFWVIRPNLSDDKNYDYGLSHEAGKINLNFADEEMLLKLPSMTSELANSIIDWRDDDSEITPGGAESEYYLLLDDPYNCKNSLLETVEEVMLIKGARADYLYGEDLNRNGVLDWNEDDAQMSKPADNSNGRLEPGFLNYVTVYSEDLDVDATGQQRASVSDRTAMIGLFNEIMEESTAAAVVEYIRNKSYDSTIDLYFELSDIYQIPYEDFIKITDKITVNGSQNGGRGGGSQQELLAGLVNINIAPEEVLLCLPGLEESEVDALVSYRSKSGADLTTIVWVTQALGDSDEAKNKAAAIGPYITTRSYQYSADIVAISGDGKAFRRYLMVIDTSRGEAVVVYRKSLTHLGWPLESQIIEDLRAGREI